MRFKSQAALWAAMALAMACGSTSSGTTSTTTGTTTSGTTTAGSGGASATTGTGGTTTTGGGMCLVGGDACGKCAPAKCAQQLTACQADATCKAEIGPNGSLDPCICAAQKKGDTAGVNKCVTDFDAKGATEQAVGDCAPTNCKMECGL